MAQTRVTEFFSQRKRTDRNGEFQASKKLKIESVTEVGKSEKVIQVIPKVEISTKSVKKKQVSKKPKKTVTNKINTITIAKAQKEPNKYEGTITTPTAVCDDHERSISIPTAACDDHNASPSSTPIKRHLKNEETLAKKRVRPTDSVRKDIIHECMDAFRTPEHINHRPEDSPISSARRRLIPKFNADSATEISEKSKLFFDGGIEKANDLVGESLAENKRIETPKMSPTKLMARLEEARSVKEKVLETPLNADLMKSKLAKCCNLAELKQALAVHGKLKVNEKGSTPTQSPVKDRLKDVASPSKVPAKDRYASLSVPSPPSGYVLPTTYQNLLNFFRSSDVVVSMLMNRHEICTFNKLKSGVEEMTKLKFGLKQIGQIKTVYPLAYHIRQEKGLPCFGQGRTVDYQMTIEANLDDVEALNTKNLSPRKSPSKEKVAFTAGKLSERKSIFHQNLLEVVKRFHKEFLNKHQIKLNVSDDKLLRWHPKFNLDEVPEVEQAELPRPPDSKKFMTAKEMLEEANNKMDPKVRSALETVAKKEKQTKNESTNVASPVKPNSPGSKPCSPSTSALKGVSQSLLDRIRAKEAQKIEASMTRTTADQKRLEMLERLPELSRILRTYFITQKRPSIPYQDAVKCITDSHKSGMGSVEVDRHLKLISEVLPEWLKVVHVSKGAFLKLDANIDMTVMIEKLNKLIRSG